MRAPPSRPDTWNEIRSGTLDVLVVGGGINGAGVARDLALRACRAGVPLRIALAEKGHFSSGTSGRNSQLIHGGLRYLKNFELRLVSEALAERAILLRTAPHLVRPLPFLLPTRSWLSAAFYEAGLWLYDLLAGKNRIEPHRFLSGARLHEVEPGMYPFWGASRFFDGRVHSARLVLLNLREAVSNGAKALNYAALESHRKDADGIWSAELKDQFTGEISTVRARQIIDATGAWSKGANPRLVRGSHIVLPRIGTSENAISYFGSDGRIVFFIPWGRNGALTLVGTTDVDHQGGPDEVRISASEVAYLRRAVQQVFPGAERTQPVAAYSSLRPLVRDDKSSATKTSREHRIWADAEGVVHISGGKYTTYRRMSAEAVELAVQGRWPALVSSNATAEEPIGGNSREVIDALESKAGAIGQEHGVAEGEVRAAIQDYGVEAIPVLEAMAGANDGSLTRLECAQIRFAVEHEWALRLSDLLFVSTYWGYERRWTRDQLLPFARELGGYLRWDAGRMDEEINAVLGQADYSLS